jgi:surface polysaccharide O-acyltransferase-like enzyme
MLSLGIRKMIVVGLIGTVLLMGNIVLVVNWLQAQGWTEWAQSVRYEYLTPTALTIVVVLLFLLVKPRTESSSWIRRCPVCDHRTRGSNNYCSDCGSKL